jgi:hypothetical protein
MFGVCLLYFQTMSVAEKKALSDQTLSEHSFIDDTIKTNNNSDPNEIPPSLLSTIGSYSSDDLTKLTDSSPTLSSHSETSQTAQTALINSKKEYLDD